MVQSDRSPAYQRYSSATASPFPLRRSSAIIRPGTGSALDKHSRFWYDVGMKVTKAVVITHRLAMDQVVLTTDLPSPVPATISADPLTLLFYTMKGTGLAYVREHFGVEPEVVEMD